MCFSLAWAKSSFILLQYRDWKFMWPAFPRSWLYDWHSPSSFLQLPFQRRDATEIAVHQLCKSAVHMLHFLHFLNYACEKMGNNSDHKQPPCFAHILSCPARKLRIHSLRGFGCFSISSGHLGITQAMCTEVFILAFYLQKKPLFWHIHLHDRMFKSELHSLPYPLLLQP